MKKILKYKKTIIISSILILIFVFTLIITKFANNKKDELSELKDAIENIFYYLPDDNYTTMNDLSDTCKLALIYDTKYLKSDYVFYDNNGKENKGYTKNNVLNSLKNIIGEESIIDFNKDNSGEYKFFYPVRIEKPLHPLHTCVNFSLLPYPKESLFFLHTLLFHL